MQNEIIEKIITHWRHNYFTEPILISVFIFCFIIAMVFRYKETARGFFLLYFFFGILLFVVMNPVDFLRVITGKKLAVLSEISNTSFELIEFTAFYYFFRKSLQNKKHQKLSKIFLISLSTIVGLFFLALTLPGYTIDSIRRHSFFINVIELFFLAFLCLAYFYELFTDIPKINLIQRPTFFIISSTFFYSVLLIPFFLLAHDMLKMDRQFYDVLFACHYIILTIMLLAISKALLSRKPITT